MLEAAQLVARLGILNSKVSAGVFMQMVEDETKCLSRSHMGTNYFPLKTPDGALQGVLSDGLNDVMTLKRTFSDKDLMKND